MISWYIVALYSTIKGTIIALTATVIGASFTQGLVIAMVSGALNIVAMITAAYIAAKATRQNREEIRAVGRKVEEKRRQTRKTD